MAQTRLNFKDITGIRYARLLVIDRASNNKVGDACWNCICDCGNRAVVRGADLRRAGKYTSSCGCWRDEQVAKANTKHGHVLNGSKTPEYQSWTGARIRCTNPKSKSYKNYGGRGINICERWSGETGFENFLLDMGKRPEGLTLDRINVNGNYEPSNCRWADSKTQISNRRIKHIEQFSDIDILSEIFKRLPLQCPTIS